MDNIKHKNISVSYKLYILDGDKEHLVEATEANQPFNFMSGMGVTLKDFEDASNLLLWAMTSISPSRRTRLTANMRLNAS